MQPVGLEQVQHVAGVVEHAGHRAEAADLVDEDRHLGALAEVDRRPHQLGQGLLVELARRAPAVHVAARVGIGRCPGIGPAPRLAVLGGQVEIGRVDDLVVDLGEDALELVDVVVVVGADHHRRAGVVAPHVGDQFLVERAQPRVGDRLLGMRLREQLVGRDARGVLVALDDEGPGLHELAFERRVGPVVVLLVVARALVGAGERDDPKTGLGRPADLLVQVLEPLRVDVARRGGVADVDLLAGEIPAEGDANDVGPALRVGLAVLRQRGAPAAPVEAVQPDRLAVGCQQLRPGDRQPGGGLGRCRQARPARPGQYRHPGGQAQAGPPPPYLPMRFLPHRRRLLLGGSVGARAGDGAIFTPASASRCGTCASRGCRSRCRRPSSSSAHCGRPARGAASAR